MVRVIWQGEATNLFAPPDDVTRFVPAIPYDATTFTCEANGHQGRCSLCLQSAATMSPAGPRRWLAYCADHDRQRRWLRDPQSHAWWYLPPPMQNDPDEWWVLKRLPIGLVGGNPGWYLYAQDGSRVVDTHSPTVHRARVVSEWLLEQLHCQSNVEPRQ